MITLTMLGSGSRGNACALTSDGAVLLLDAGFSARELERRAERAGVPLSRLAGIALTHEHGDHTQGAVRLAERYGAPIVCTKGTWRALRAPDGIEHRAVGSATTVRCGPFTVTACPLLHDAIEPVALTASAGGTRVAVAYDFGRPTQALRYFLRHAHALVLESNYDEVLLRTSDYPASVQHRIAGSGGHLSNRATAALLTELIHPGLDAVVLAHLSQQCNSATAAQATVEPALRSRGFGGTFAVALQDVPLAPIRVARLSAASPVLDLFDSEP